MEKYKICQSKHGTGSRARALDSSVETLIIAAPASKRYFLLHEHNNDCILNIIRLCS